MTGDLAPAVEETAGADLPHDCLSRDRPALEQALSRLPAPQRDARRWPEDLRQRIEASRARFAARAAALPRPTFPEELPVSARREEIARAIGDHQVVIVCGETGSGKTTQIPKICLELGRGAAGLIGHTQPRRIAARATAARIAQELASPLGQAVGYKIRFTDKVSPQSYVKLMTDGILLAETQGDPWLAAYDTLIIDEAHERSLNIDFLLGYLRQLAPRRPDLKVIVTSATLDAGRLAAHFATAGQPAPVIEVSGRLYPIEVRWRPVEGEERGSRDLPAAIVDAVDEAQRCGPGHVLVFLPGEREIREAAEALRKHHPAGTERQVRGGIELLPLFARQSAQEQQRVFAEARGRRIVLATNVAETSLTVPGVRYVIDTGLARVKRYSPRNKVEQLRVEPVSRAAASQRAGRCGRVQAGVCFRLYDEQDFQRRPEFTDPEILRSSLAGVILRMKALGLGDVEDFPFIDRPAPRLVSDGYQLLMELGAVDEARDLTTVGQELARLPTDPKIGRMILAARETGALREVLVIASALSVQDPRERPQESAAAADAAHARWRDERSEFLAWVKLWAAFDEVWEHQSQRKQRDWCRASHLSWLRMREWRDVHAQLHVLAAEHGWRENDIPASFEAIHKALLAGLLGHIGLKSEEDRLYLGARGIKFLPHPGFSLAKKAGRWIVAAELVETTRLFARTIARIEPEWLEQVGAHLVSRHTYDPHWEKRAGQVMAFESGTLHGLTLYARRRVAYGRIDPKAAREVFIREALVGGEMPEDSARRMPFLRHNLELVAQIEALESRARRPDVLVDETLIQAFYDLHLPADISDVRAFDAWRREQERAQPKLLFLEREQLMRHEAAGITTERFPRALALRGLECALEYRFEPGAGDDGVTLVVPLAALNQVPAARAEWLVPGMIEDKVLALVRTLPQKIRHRLQPLGEYAADFAAREHDLDQPLLKMLARDVEERVSLKLPPEAVRLENLPPHLFMNFRVVDEHGRVLGQSRSLADLRSRLAGQAEAAFAVAARAAKPQPAGGGEGAVVGSAGASTGRVAGTVAATARAAAVGAARGADAGTETAGAKGAAAIELDGLTDWSFGELPELMEVTVDGRALVGFPALVDQGRSVALRVFDTPEKAAQQHRAGLRRLFALALVEQMRYLEKNLPGLRDMALQFMALGSETELRAQLVAATLERICMAEPWPTDATAFEARRQEARPRLALVGQELARLVGSILAEHGALQKKLAAMGKAFPAAVEDIRAQCAALLGKEFIVATPFERLQHYPRYLKAASLRLEKLHADPARDARLLAQWQALAKPFERERAVRARAGVADAQLAEFRWLLEELRVGMFAQELRTPVPVSVKRLQKIWEARPGG
ncbi:MAG: ATP-dependent RNA helicase HrpA [Betaproteobacteria bacterium]|nr:ATP-dependent RNA helicase HrpA [Betaproteobacteria bacterium]